MKIANVLESGIAGAATLTLLRETLDHMDPKVSGTSFFQKKGVIRELKKSMHKKGIGGVKIYIKLAAELLGLAGVLGLSSLGKKKNALLRGVLLGGITGVVAVLVNDNADKEKDPSLTDQEIWRKRIVTVALYMLGGLIAGGAVNMIKKRKKKK
jgi:hypothetical protein